MIGALLACWVVVGHAVDTDDADGSDAAAAAADPLADARFAFCHEEGADADQVAAWCELLRDAPPDACPGMRATCASGKFAAEPSGCDALTGGGAPSGGYADAPDGDESPWRRTAEACDGGEGVGFVDALLRWGMAGLVAVLLVIVLRALWSWLGGRRRPVPQEGPSPEIAAPVLAGLEGDDDLGAQPEDALLAQARRALAEGRLADAVLLARGASLRRLARRGLLTLHKARTDREYVRGVAREPDTRALLADVLGAVEALRWAGHGLTVERATQAVGAAARLLAAALLLVAVAWPGLAVAGPRRNAPYGDAALYELMEGAGFTVSTAGGSFTDLDADVAAVILDLYSVQPTVEDWAAIRAWTLDGGLLIVAGDPTPHLPELGVYRTFTGEADSTARSAIAEGYRMSVPRLPHGPTAEFCAPSGELVPLIVLPAGAARLPASDRVAGAVAGDTDWDTDWDTDRDTDLATGPDTDQDTDRDTAGDRDPSLGVYGPRAAPDDVVGDGACPEPAIVEAISYGVGEVVAVSDPRLLRNAAMVLPANRAFLLELMGQGYRVSVPWGLGGDETIVIASATSVSAPANPIESMANLRMLPFILHLLSWWVLLALWRGWPLSPLRPPVELGRLAFVDHVGALGRHWETTGATRHAASQVAQLALQRHGTAGLAALAHRAGRDPAVIVPAAVDLATHPDGPDRPGDLAILEELWTLIRTRRT